MPKNILKRPTRWENIVLLCGKCAHKLNGGYGPKRKDRLRTILRKGLAETGHRRDVRIIETRCMGLCPKNVTTLVITDRPDAIFAIPAGTSQADALSLVFDTGEQS
jgi:predicted metal-binding protein